MESILVMIFCALALYYLSRRQDQVAESLIGEEFDRFERIYNSVTYSCHDATVVRKSLHSSVALPIVPSPNYHARALCLTEEGHWFWFDASIRYMKLSHTRITPTTQDEALEALKDDPEILQRYFPNFGQKPSA
ncbi:hypothetical protein [Endozoicomonas sp. Mp262]|uniref:hypothetical protein n=1 Tax=Endozoicomonas sp. Mp262 TaxID=2919499 RepID=UPI0021DA7659